MIDKKRIQAACVVLACLLTALRVSAAGPAPEKIPVILDTDIGSDVDDAFALALILASPELDLRGVTTVSGDTQARAWMVCRLLTAVGRRDIPVAAGAGPQPAQDIGGQFQYRNHPAVIFNRTARPIKEPAVEFLYGQIKQHPNELTLITVGPLTNVARLLADHPDSKPWIKRIVLMGGSVRVGYKGTPPVDVEWNIKCDVKAAREVFSSGVPLVVAPLDATASAKLEAPLRRQLFRAGTALTYQVQALYQMWDQPTPTLFDPVAVALSFTERFCTMEDLPLEVDERGFTRIGKGKPNARVATAIEAGEFLKWYVQRVASAGKSVPAREPANLSHLVPHGNMPNRVHAAEDFETDIERRWWMSGKAETANVPVGSRRACRGILTQDFDDLMGDTRTMYTAVIFNPVPGPPMGKNTRLSFRYWLKGTDTLRVQIYSLTRGFHRYLSLRGLPQESWQSGTVDMTAARRPDGSGGPLSEDERIDDIQFYADPRAELIVDDIVLYDVAVPGEARPFPRRVLFTGWFDTGKQGEEWPGTFEIVAKKPPLTWKAAHSVPDAKHGFPWIQLNLRGERTLGGATELFFRYHLSGADSVSVQLVNRKANTHQVIEVKNLKRDEWAEKVLDFGKAGIANPNGKSPKGEPVDEIWFVLPEGAELLIDDVLLYEPGAEHSPEKARTGSR